MRTCVEVEANLTAILLENGYAKRGGGNLTMRDYRLIEHSHRLSSFEAKLPLWRGPDRVRRPFAPWASKTTALPWYRAYNAAKHDRHASFHRANFESLLDAMCALVVLLSAQFCVETFAPGGKPLMTRDYGRRLHRWLWLGSGRRREAHWSARGGRRREPLGHGDHRVSPAMSVRLAAGARCATGAATEAARCGDRLERPLIARRLARMLRTWSM